MTRKLIIENLERRLQQEYPYQMYLRPEKSGLSLFWYNEIVQVPQDYEKIKTVIYDLEEQYPEYKL